MSIYSGFPTRKDEENYNSLLTKLITTLQTHLLQLIGEAVPQQKIKIYTKIISKMKEYEQHKYLPPKFSQLLSPLARTMGLQAAIEQRVQYAEPVIEQRLKGYKQSSRLKSKQHRFHSNYESYNGGERRNEAFEQKRQHTQGNLMKAPLFHSASKLSKPKVSKAIFPLQQRRIELGGQHQQQSEVLQYWQTFNRSKISKQGGLAPKINSNFRYKAYQALQQAQSNINKHNIPLRQQMRRKLKAQQQGTH